MHLKVSGEIKSPHSHALNVTEEHWIRSLFLSWLWHLLSWVTLSNTICLLCLCFFIRSHRNNSPCLVFLKVTEKIMRM